YPRCSRAPDRPRAARGGSLSPRRSTCRSARHASRREESARTCRAGSAAASPTDVAPPARPPARPSMPRTRTTEQRSEATQISCGHYNGRGRTRLRAWASGSGLREPWAGCDGSALAVADVPAALVLVLGLEPWPWPWPWPLRIRIRRLQSKRQAERPEAEQEQRPDDNERHRVRQHHRRDGADARAAHVALAEDNDQRKVRHQGRDDVRARIADAVRRLRQLGRQAD